MINFLIEKNEDEYKTFPDHDFVYHLVHACDYQNWFYNNENRIDTATDVL